MSDTSAPAPTAAPATQADTPAPSGKTWADVVDNLQHYAAAAGLVALIAWGVKEGMLDKDMLELAVVGVASLVGIKITR